MIKNVVFDIGKVILNFEYERVLNAFSNDKDEREFILNNVINSPEWSKNKLIDTGFISKEDAIKIVQDRTNHTRDQAIEDFWNNYNSYAFIDERVLNIIKKLRKKGFKIYLLSNTNPYTYSFVKVSGLFDLVDGYILSYKEHQVKPYRGIYYTLLDRYNLNQEECIYIDDDEANINTACEIGMLGKLVEPDNYYSIVEVIKENNLLTSEELAKEEQ